jgi:UDP-2-acetamido-2,6-beta-L-arabino-hexul-4-ose reductase
MTDALRTIAITGAHGFLGWHLSCRLRAIHGIEAVRLGRDSFDSVEVLAEALQGAETVIHLAGVNRADSDAEVEAGNLDLAKMLAAALRNNGRPIHIVYGNSIQALQDNAYGRGKAGAAQVLRDAADVVAGTLADILLPNLFGEHGRPHHNSFIATFCHALASGGRPEVKVDNEVPLLHAQNAAAILIEAAGRRESHQVTPEAERRKVSETLATLEKFRDNYATGEIPQLTSNFDVDLFNTYRSFLFPDHFPMLPQLHADPRGELSEVVRTHGGTGMAFVSTTRPGKLRGDHYHLRKIERFYVAVGEAEISLRRLLDDKVVTFRVSGDAPGFVDMPTLWVHNIRNVGESDLVTVFWADQLLDQENPDQYPERVEIEDVNP